MATLSVVVFSFPGMKQLTQCLESVLWADGVMVRHLADGGRIVSTEEVKRSSKSEEAGWVLHLWGEERVEAELREELQALRMRAESSALLSYHVPIRSRLLGGWAEGSLWGPSPSVRLCREAKALPPGWWEAAEKGAVVAPGLLRGWIGDYSLVELGAGVDWLNRLSNLWAAQAQAREQDLSPVNMVSGSLRVFLRLLWMNGFLSHGLAGLTLSTMAAYAKLLSGAKLWEARTLKGKMKNEK